jgi:hypothetical protein
MADKSDELQEQLLRAAVSFLEHAGTSGQSILVSLPGGMKLGVELEILGRTAGVPDESAGRVPSAGPTGRGAARLKARV